MKATSIQYIRTLYGWLRGDAPALQERAVSQAINLARLTLILGLVFLHYQEYPNSNYSPFDGLDVTQHQLPTYINSFVLFFFFSAVPVLSVISGWLFFAFPDEGAGTALLRRIRRRSWTLYMPLVVWNAAFLVVLLAVFASHPQAPLLDEIHIDLGNAGWLDYVNAVFAVTARPIGYQFWFIRDLFVTVLVSPLLWWLLRRVPYLTLVLLGGAWLAGSGLLIFFRTDVVFFFCIGGFLRMRRLPLDIGARAAWTLMGVYVVLVALRALAPTVIVMDHPRPELLTLATRSMRLIGVLACWGVLLQLNTTRVGAWLARYGWLSFFLYAAHFPLIAWVKIVLWRWVPSETDGWMLAHYFASVGVTVMIAVSAALLLARLLPGGFALMNGGRRVQADLAPRRA